MKIPQTIRLTAALCALSAAMGVRAQTPATALTLPAPAAGYTFPQKQTLTFAVDWRVFTAGIATFHLEQTGPIMQVTATADTVGATNMIYQVIDRFQSTFNTTTGCSVNFRKQIQEGRRKLNSEMDFNYAAGQLMFSERNLIKGTSKQQQTAIPACATDSLSGIFYAASQTLTPGTNFQFPLGDAQRTVAVTMKVLGREEVKTPAGTFQTIKVQPTADAGVVKNRGSIVIWYTDDARHMPVQIRASLFWLNGGSILFRLQSAENK